MLKPYVVDEIPSEKGEISLHCPIHPDAKRSASLNVETGLFYCHAEAVGSTLFQLFRRKDEWKLPPAASARKRSSSRRKPAAEGTPPNEASVAGWNAALLGNEKALDVITTQRGLTVETIDRFELGWDSGNAAYTIPVRDEDGTLVNVRSYTPNPSGSRRKIWSINGYGSPRLYPMQILDDDPHELVFAEGELDALLTIQNGFPAITRTASAKVWQPGWTSHFKDRVVRVALDADDTGQDGNKIVARALQRSAKSVYVVTLPFKIKEKHGKDLTDYWMDGHTPDEFREMLDAAEPFGRKRVNGSGPRGGNVQTAQDAKLISLPQALEVTVKGRWSRRFSIPREVGYECTRDAGEKCAVCPLNAAGGSDTLEIEADDPVVLELMESTKTQVANILRNAYGAPVCPKLEIDIKSHQSAEILYARDNIDYTRNGAGVEPSSYEAIKLISVGRHDTQPNTTIKVVGAVQPDPRRQYTEFQAWELQPLETSLDTFEIDAKTFKLLQRFQVKAGQPPLSKLRQIAGELERHVTRIYGRPELHALIDLVFHSVLAFKFAGRYERKGWLDALVIGDTRTGKSEAASSMIHHYNAGEIISCEAASFAGIIGGLQTFGRDGKEWSVTWGVVPLNDRRMVVLDEISGLTSEQIGAMSSVRSSGIAELQKIVQERTSARTRLIWMGNPRMGRTMSDYTFGVQAIRPLIGTNEDIARFDIAMSLRQDEISSQAINRQRKVGRQLYTSDACHQLVRWVWSRSPDQVRWLPAAERMVYSVANELGRRYVEEPPLVQAANVRTKVARISVALAARLFSTDAKGECIVVRPEHVRDAVRFMDHLYGMKNFGYRERSAEIINDRKLARKRRREIKHYLLSRPGLDKFLRGHGAFRRQDLEEMMNYSREETNGIINTLWDAHMIRREGPEIRIEPTLHDILRSM